MLVFLLSCLDAVGCSEVVPEALEGVNQDKGVRWLVTITSPFSHLLVQHACISKTEATIRRTRIEEKWDCDGEQCFSDKWDGRTGTGVGEQTSK